MTDTTSSTVVRRETTVPTSVERAFAIFTERYGEVTPPEHHLLAAPWAETVVELRVGGEIYDRATDGSECHWGEVLAYEPPSRFVFSWKIGPDWNLVADPATASEVEVTFTALGPDSTRVVLEHRHLDRHGPGWESLPAQLGSGWPLYLERLEGLAGSV